MKVIPPKKKIYRCFSLLPAICMMLAIFLFSAQDATESGTLSIGFTAHLLNYTNRISITHLSSEQVLFYSELLDTLIRKTAHFTEYTILSLSLLIPFTWVYQYKYFRHHFYIFLFCVFYACSDEFHQLFVPGRYGCLKDVFIDSCGAFLGLLIIRLILKIIRSNDRQHP